MRIFRNSVQNTKVSESTLYSCSKILQLSLLYTFLAGLYDQRYIEHCFKIKCSKLVHCLVSIEAI